jgi:hypothetical protein
MFTRAFVASIVFLALPQTADASERSGVLHRMSCTVVRYYVAKYSEGAAEAWARSKGATEAEIQSARRCLGGGSNTQTVGLVK